MRFPFCFILILISSFVFVHSKLLFTIWLVRHGAREPYKLPTEIIDFNKTEFQGFRTLTNIGTRQHYFLGKYFRKIYKNWLGEINPGNVIIRSTGCSRTLMSASAFAYGLTQKKNTNENNDKNTKLAEIISKLPFKITNEKITKQFKKTYRKIYEVSKFPIQNILEDEDFVSKGYKQEVCPNVIKIKHKFEHTKKHKKIIKRGNKYVIPIMKKTFDRKFKQAEYPYKAEELLFTKYFELRSPVLKLSEHETEKLSKGATILKLRRGLFLPSIVKFGCHHLFKQFINLFKFAIQRDLVGELKFMEQASKFHEKIYERDRSYQIYDEFVENNQVFLPALKAVVYSNHDDLIYMIMRAISDLSIEKISTPFASLLIFELHKEDDGKYYVKLRYDNNEELKLRGCKNKDMCELSEFLYAMRTGGMFNHDEEYFNKCGYTLISI